MSGIISPADLPGPRLTALEAWAASVPDWSSIPGGRRVTVTDSGNLTTNGTPRRHRSGLTPRDSYFLWK
jgi:hypothetical protein